MKLLELTLPTPEENLALDEALLDQAEADEDSFEVLRLWEPEEPFVVVGRSSRLAEEVKGDECRRRGIPVLRRSSGGTSVVAGPGCLMYAVVLSLNARPELRAIDHAHRFVLGRIAAALGPLVPGVRCRGTSDLVFDRERKCPTGSADGSRACENSETPQVVSPSLKVSGNSARVKRNWLLYHGTLLYNFPIELIETCLPQPPREPDYRAGRSHERFVTNLPIGRGDLRQAMITGWQADQPLDDWPRERMVALIAQRYGLPEWHADR
jgi:lipoate-protein ligase A